MTSSSFVAAVVLRTGEIIKKNSRRKFATQGFRLSQSSEIELENRIYAMMKNRFLTGLGNYRV